MNTKRSSLVLLIILIAIVVCIHSACDDLDSNHSNTDPTIIETQLVPSTVSDVLPSIQESDSNDYLKSVYEGDVQKAIISMIDNQNGVSEMSNDMISNAFVNEDGYLFIVLSDKSMIDAGLVDDTSIRAFESEKQYTVNFYDYDGTLICSKQVNEGEMAIAPKNPVRDGYSFVGWDRSFVTVDTDLEVTAQYEPLQSAPQIIVNDAAVFSDTSTIEVKLTVENNPGILGMTLQLDYDSRYYSLIKAENGAALNMLSFTKPGRFESPCKFSWDGIDLSESDICDGIILTLTFEVSENIQQGVYPITLTYEEDGIIDRDLSPTDVNIKQGCIVII